MNLITIAMNRIAMKRILRALPLRPLFLFLLALLLVLPRLQGFAQANPPTLKTRPADTPAKAAASGSPSRPKTVLPTEDTVNSFLFQMFGYDPTTTWKVGGIKPSEIEGLAEVTVVISNKQGPSLNRLFVSSDGKHVISGEVLPFGAKPFEDSRIKLEKGVNGPAKGPAKADVLIVEFSDMQCPHCQKAAPIIEQLVALEPEARFVFQNYPLPSHNWAAKAASFVDCVGRAPSGETNDAVWKYIQKLFEDQSNITEANADQELRAAATSAGANADEIAACAAKPETKARVEASVALGLSVGVSATPMLFVNGRMVNGGAPLDVLKKLVDFEESQAKSSGGEKADK